jgi:hypothetical protein
MGVFVFLPLVLPLTAWPMARLAERHLHPRTATRLLTWLAVVMAVCSTVCLGLVMVVGTAQLPGNPLPDGWSDPEVREAAPYDEVAGRLAIPALLVVLVACGRMVWRHGRIRRRAHRALAGLPDTETAVLPDEVPYAYALPGGGRGRVVVTTGLLDRLEPAERRALFAHVHPDASVVDRVLSVLLTHRPPWCSPLHARPERDVTAFSVPVPVRNRRLPSVSLHGCRVRRPASVRAGPSEPVSQSASEQRTARCGRVEG